ncbi:MAG TPA: DUF86 domain-containing protein [Chthoniobacterales bacterium]|nr:DUF86 domain-containing protein [Chthoniobacterales bacterium]
MLLGNFFMTVATKKLLLDVREAGESILQHTAGKSLAEYTADRFFRRAVEREFEIIGEALNRIDRLDPPVAKRISELRPIVDFRNRIIHGYDTVDDTLVWGIVERHLPVLINEIADLLDADDATA